MYDYFGCCCRKSKMKKNLDILDKGTEIIEDMLDTRYILSKLQEIDKLKKCMMTKEQLILFNNIPKPYLRVNENEGTKKETVELGKNEINQALWLMKAEINKS